MNRLLKTTLCGTSAALALAFSGAAFADNIVTNIGGLLVPSQTPGMGHFEATQIYENVITQNGQELRGVGRVESLNGTALGNLCAAGANTCQLTFTFGGLWSQNYTTESGEFTGGWINFYLNTDINASYFDPFNSTGSAEDFAKASFGTLFLTLAGHETLGKSGSQATLFSAGEDFGTGSDAGKGSGLLDVDYTGLLNGNTAGAGGLANAFFDTNSITANLGGFADFLLTSSFSSVIVPHPEECQGPGALTGPMCLAGTMDMRGKTNAVPEPATLGLLGLGALGLAALRRRKQA